MADRKYRHPQVNLRLPEELKEKVAEFAAKHGRSANAEMVAAIEAWVSSQPEPEEDAIKALEDRVTKIEVLLSNEKRN